MLRFFFFTFSLRMKFFIISRAVLFDLLVCKDRSCGY